MNQTTTFRFDAEEAAALEIIRTYLADMTPGLKPNVSDAIRYAVAIAATNIRLEQAKQPEGDPR